MKYITDAFGTTWAIDPFTYSVRRDTVIPVNGNFQLTLETESNSDFVWVASAYYIGDVGAASVDWLTQFTGLLTVDIKDTTSGRTLMNGPTPLPSIANVSGQELEYLPVPREIKAKTSLQFSFVNLLSALTFPSLTFSLIGFKKYEL